MQRLITDLLVQDYIGKSTCPTYEIEGPALMIDNDKSIKEHNSIMQISNVILPLVELDTPWSNPQWRKNPKELDRLISSLFLEALKQNLNTIKVNNSEQFLALSSEKDIGSLIISKSLFLKHVEYFSKHNLYRTCVIVDGFPEDRVLCVPDPEFVGVIPVQEEKFIGGLLILKNLTVIELKESV